MDQVTLIFVGGDAEIDKLITGVTGGPYSHVAGLLFDGVLESTGEREATDPYPGVWLHRPDKYDDNNIIERVTVNVPDMDGLKNTARSLIGKPYGYLDCIRGGIKELTGEEITDNAIGMNCSELWTRILRGGNVAVLDNEPAGDVTPMALYKAVTA